MPGDKIEDKPADEAEVPTIFDQAASAPDPAQERD
jgi:hypothetical protein